MTRSIQDEINQTNAEEVIGQVERVDAADDWASANIAEFQDLFHDIEDDAVFDKSIIVNLSQELNLRNATLIVLEIILLQSDIYGLDDVVDYPYDEFGTIPVEMRQKGREHVKLDVFDLARFRKSLLQYFTNLESFSSDIHFSTICVTHLGFFPMHPANLSGDLLDGTFGQINIE